MAEPEVHELDQLMRVCRVGAGESSARAKIAESNWRRWRNGTSPHMAKFRKLKIAVINLAIEKGALPRRCHHQTISELVDIAKRGGVA